MLSIKNIDVLVEKKIVLKNFSLDIDKGSIHVIMGPNGVGKSTLSRVIMGDNNYKIENGSITFNGEDITNMSTDMRSRLGIFLAMQYPLDVDSLKIVAKNIVKYKEENKDIAILIITHLTKILEYIKPDYVHVLGDGHILKTGDYSLALDIEKDGYKKYLDKSNIMLEE